MRRHARTFIVIGIALAAAAVSSLAVYRAVQRIPERRVEVATTYAVVAARPLSAGAMLARSDVKLVAWPAHSPLAGAYTKVDQVVNRGLLDSVVENQPITHVNLAPKGAGAGLPPSIPDGMRAISLKVNEVIGVAGFVVPGTHVDVVAVASIQRGRRQDSMARVVVSDVEVLAAGTRYDQEKARNGKPIPTTVVTIAVTPGDAERIALAQDEGRVMLTLRNPLDRLPTKTTGVRMASLMGSPQPPPVRRVIHGRRVMVAPKPVNPKPKPYTIETIRASKRSIEVIP